jgi:serine/threonine-protein kinase
MPLGQGEVFAGYTVIRLLGSGGMGEVYLVQHPRMPRREALKILPSGVSVDPEFRTRFIREADLAATLFHPHIVGIHDRGDFADQLWIAMDYIDGPDTARLLTGRQPGGLPTSDVLDLVNAVGEALDDAHGNGLLHRDVKPANVLITKPDAGRRRIFLADFGIARRLDDISGLTATNMAVGTVNYAAPEQLMGHPIDGRADQYALAATAVHWLTGSPPFQHTNPAVVISHHLNAQPPRLADSRPGLAAFDAVLSRALAKDPRDRFPTCSDFSEALQEAGGRRPNFHSAPTLSATAAPSAVADRHSVTTPGPPAPPSRSWSRILVAALLGVLVAAGVIGILGVTLLRHAGSSAPQRAAESSAPVGPSPTTPPPRPAGAPAPPVPAAPSQAGGTSSPPSSNRYAIPACYSVEDLPNERPTDVTFEYCADGGADLDHMTWTSWGPDGAEGEGYLSVNTCQPNCADGGQLHYPVKIVAANPEPAATSSGCPSNTSFYTELILAFPHNVPNGTNGESINSQYQGMPAIRFTTGQTNADTTSLGPSVCI